MKKIFLVLSLGIILSLASAGVVLANKDCNDGSSGHTWTCSDDDPCGTYTAQCVPVSTGVTGGSSIEGPKECVRLRNNVTVDIKNAQGSLQETTFSSGSEVCSAKVEEGILDCFISTSWADGQRCYTKEAGIVVLLNTIFTVTNWLFYIITLIVVLMVIYGGFVILTASGDPDKAGKGRGILTYAIIGLAVALLARIIPSVVQFIMGV